MSGLRRELAGAGLLLFMMGPAAGRGQTVRRVRRADARPVGGSIRHKR